MWEGCRDRDEIFFMSTNFLVLTMVFANNKSPFVQQRKSTTTIARWPSEMEISLVLYSSIPQSRMRIDGICL